MNPILFLEETASTSDGSTRTVIILLVAVLILGGIAVWQLISNRKLEKKLKAAEEKLDELSVES